MAVEPMKRPTLDRRLVQANELGIRLEIVGGLPLWEFSPARRHQQAVDRIRASIAPIVQAAAACLQLPSSGRCLRQLSGWLPEAA